MIITALPSAPLPTDNTATFNSKAFALVAALNTFVTEANALGVDANADAAAALASQIAAGLSEDAAISAANFKGAWSGLTGALAIPASVSHLSRVWILTESVANVTTEIPGTSSKWIPASIINIPQSGAAKTSSYALATSDVGQFIEVGSGGSITIPDATFAAGDAVSIFNNTSGNVTITCSITTAYIAGTNTDKATVTLATRGIATILFISGTVCVMGGNLT